jgi:hypothetical protein
MATISVKKSAVMKQCKCVTGWISVEIVAGDENAKFSLDVVSEFYYCLDLTPSTPFILAS